jgi:hypothetical protein
VSDETSELEIDLAALENMTEQEVEALLAGSQSPEELLKLLNKLLAFELFLWPQTLQLLHQQLCKIGVVLL